MNDISLSHISSPNNTEYQNILNCPSKWSEHPNLYNTSGFETIDVHYNDYNVIDVFKILCIVCLYTAAVFLLKYSI